MLSRQLQKRQREDAPGAEAAEPRKPPRKLARRAASAAARPAQQALQVHESALFRPVRAIGLVTDGLPVALSSLGDSDFVVASAKRGFQVFECKKLRLAYIGPRLNEKVRCLLCAGEVVLTALKTDIVAWYKLTELGRFRGHTSSVTVMCIIGAGYLVSSSGTEVFVWQLSDVGTPPTGTQKHTASVLSPLFQLKQASDFGECTAMCHPPTYLHKVLTGGSSGGLSLWNVRTQGLIHTFSAHAAGKADSAVTCLREAPNILDVVAIGFASGRICMLNVREDRVLMEFEQVQGRITALAFRTGPNAPAHLISGASNGAFVVWDLDKRIAHHAVDAAHHGPVVTASFIPGQPVLLTSGRDNALRMWIFDTADGLPRLLKSRVGCPGPARRMGFYGSGNDKELIVGGGAEGAGYVAKISFIQDHQNVQYSQAALKKLPAGVRRMQPGQVSRLPPLVDIAFCEVRHYDWPAVVTAHRGVDSAMVWSAANQALAPMVLRPESEAECAPVSAVAISPCGNYCVIGLENGLLHRFNLQSGLHRGTLPLAPSRVEAKVNTKAAKSPPPRAHTGRVCGVEISVSGQVISAASSPDDCRLRVWKLMTHEALASVPLASPRSGTPSCLLIRSHASFIAASLDDGTLLVVDLHSAAVVRSFSCGVPAVDAAFSSEGRWLAVALCDGGLRIFDLPAARCVDSLMFARPALCLCFAPSTAFLLTSHTKGNSLQVWANKFLFDPSLSAPLLRPEPEKPVMVDEACNNGEQPGDDEEDDDDDDVGDAKEDAAAQDKAAKEKSATPLGPDLLTLSDDPPAKWMATLHLDLVKERNRPKDAPKPLPSAPFFLPTAHEGVEPRFLAPDELEAKNKLGAAPEDHFTGGKAKKEAGVRSLAMPFQLMLRGQQHDEALAFLKKQTPSGVHLAIEEIGPLSGGDVKDLRCALEFFAYHLGKAHYADELQAYLTLFLEVHGEEVAAEPDLRALCSTLCRSQEGLWTALNAQCHKVRCFLGLLTHTQSQW